jgi:hypothetical protein
MKKTTTLFTALLVFFSMITLRAQVTFGSAQETLTGVAAANMMVADFNNDGKADVFIRTTNALKLYLGNGTTTLSAPLTLPSNSINITISIFTYGDLNNDGNLDIIVHDRGTGELDTLLGNGTGEFIHLPTAASTQEYSSPCGIVCADFNNDGNRDVIVSTSGSTYELMKGNGDGTFQARTGVSLPPSPATGGVFIAEELNNDGNMDLTTVKGFLYGNGAGGFSSSAANNSTNYPNSFISTDFNNDGFKDLAVASSGLTSNYGKMTLYVSNGSNALNPAYDFSYATGTKPLGIAKGDFNNDGFIDIATCDSNNVVSVYIGTGLGNFDAPFQLTLGALPNAIQIADINSDGKLDIIVGATTTPSLGKLIVFYNTSTLSSAPFSQNSDPFSLYPNPTNGLFTIQSNTDTPCHYTIHDSSGKSLEIGNFSSLKTIDITKFQSGLYLISIQKEQVSQTYKIIKI